MNPTDATLVLLLAARIHGTDEAVRASAKNRGQEASAQQKLLQQIDE
jgi:hypothetical protein